MIKYLTTLIQIQLNIGVVNVISPLLGAHGIRKMNDVLNKLWLTGVSKILYIIISKHFYFRMEKKNGKKLPINIHFLKINPYLLISSYMWTFCKCACFSLNFSHHVWDVLNSLFALAEILWAISRHIQAKIQPLGKFCDSHTKRYWWH